MFAAARWSVGVVLLSLAALAHAGDRGAREWLERMSESMSTRNYEARFFRIRDSRSDGWRIIHRVDRGRATERLVSLDGSGREYIRNEAEVICYLPDQRKVLVEKRAQESTLLSTVPVYSERLEANYSIELGGATKTLGRRTQLILVKPRDQFRYGYRLWLDEETAMPLKSQLVDRNGNIIEQILFAELHFRERISADALKPSVATDGFQWIYQDTQPEIRNATLDWVIRPPAGFRLTTWRVQAIAGSSAPVQHLVYSDGLASVSVFIEPRNPQSEPIRGLAKVGAAFAYSRDLDGHQVTAVGEVPAVTVQAIATGVTKEPDTAASALVPAPEARSPR
jgi:sigma-E factor negative regulatory protein RseB